MAMAFAPLAIKTKISFDERDVVNKSYPSFWQDMENLGFDLLE
jgi:3-phosphoshikimate 1-carboxyvinyltransferase